MEISNNTFSAVIRKYENEVKTEETEQMQEDLPETSQALKEFAQQQCLQAQETANSNGDCFVRSDGNVATISNINIHVDEPENVEASGEVSAAKIASETIQKAAQAPSYSAEELDYIKKLIYNSHHSFIANFRDADTFFEYVNTKKDSSITKETGITRSQLISLTQNDKWEDNHQDFFGSLNRSFYSLDEDNDGKLSYDEVKTFLNTYLKKDGYNDFKNKVQEYSDEIQKKFESKSNQGKLEYAIELTRDYFKAIGEKGANQLKALDRLLAGTDTNENALCKIGQISIVEYKKPEEANKLGGYGSNLYIFGYTNKNDNSVDTDKAYSEVPAGEKLTIGTPNKLSNGDGTFTQVVGYFSNDDDYTDDKGDFHDMGLSLSSRYLAKGAKWETLVDTLVHELTHATRSIFSSADSAGYLTITEDTLNKLNNVGVFKNDAEFEEAKNHLKQINDKCNKYYVSLQDEWYGQGVGQLSSDDSQFLSRLTYLMTSASGEYMAYQADADYLDSIAGDEFLSLAEANMAVNGDAEKDAIIKHLEQCGYNNGYMVGADGNIIYGDDGNPKTGHSNEPLPDWKWWSYA